MTRSTGTRLLLFSFSPSAAWDRKEFCHVYHIKCSLSFKEVEEEFVSLRGLVSIILESIIELSHLIIVKGKIDFVFDEEVKI